MFTCLNSTRLKCLPLGCAFQPRFHTSEAKCLRGWSKDVRSRVHPADPGHSHRWGQRSHCSSCCRFCCCFSRYENIGPEMALCRKCLGNPSWYHELIELFVNSTYNRCNLYHRWPKRICQISEPLKSEAKNWAGQQKWVGSSPCDLEWTSLCIWSALVWFLLSVRTIY